MHVCSSIRGERDRAVEKQQQRRLSRERIVRDSGATLKSSSTTVLETHLVFTLCPPLPTIYRFVFPAGYEVPVNVGEDGGQRGGGVRHAREKHSAGGPGEALAGRGKIAQTAREFYTSSKRKRLGRAEKKQACIP